ncbi:uncharacterized protein LOC116601991 [Nematostella vectensis]|uniref:uncharacterized protein LOC116601991 n=1 Tax=Nematostella vectensis TaxID=45351 RepID=UPI0013901433|nr:uncharacterized protein LOC116601991 [Nematostella vectensis]XP_032218861.1 uncharacterized protein LOC116601991 [Nematostella vectensis]
MPENLPFHLLIQVQLLLIAAKAPLAAEQCNITTSCRWSNDDLCSVDTNAEDCVLDNNCCWGYQEGNAGKCFNRTFMEGRIEDCLITPPISCKSQRPWTGDIGSWGDALKGKILEEQFVVSRLQCHDFCTRNARCAAVNVGPVLMGKRVCELLEATDSVQTQQRAGYSGSILIHEEFRKTYLESGCSTQ